MEQNGFRQGRSTAAHILALIRIIEEIKKTQKESSASIHRL